MVVLEAMAAGVPVVATRVEGVPEAIRDGLDGLLVPPGDPNALAQAIARVVRAEVDWLAFRSNALERHAQLFSDRAMACGVAQVYRTIKPQLFGRGIECWPSLGLDLFAGNCRREEPVIAAGEKTRTE